MLQIIACFSFLFDIYYSETGQNTYIIWIKYEIVYQILSQDVIYVLCNGCRLSLFRSLIKATCDVYICIVDTIAFISSVRSPISASVDRIFGTFCTRHTGSMRTLDSLFSDSTRIDHLGHHIDRSIDRCNQWFTRPPTHSQVSPPYPDEHTIFHVKKSKVLNEDLKESIRAYII